MSTDIAAVRQELAASPVGAPSVAMAELAALVRMGSVWRRSGGAAGITAQVSSPSGAVVRRIASLMASLALPRPRLMMRAPGGVRTSTTWAAVVDQPALEALGVLVGGRLVATVPGWRDAPSGALRGLALVALSVSGPRSPAHVEITLPTVALADDVLALVTHHGVRLRLDEDRARLVGKSHGAVIRLLDAAGAREAARIHREHASRRAARQRAVAQSNAEMANVVRAVRAAQEQLEDLRALRNGAGWHQVPAPLQAVALARLANPESSLADIGRLCDPPVGKSTVHRRLARLRELARGELRDPASRSDR